MSWEWKENGIIYLCIQAVVKGQVENAELPLESIKNCHDNGKIRFQFCNGKICTDPHKYTLLLISTCKLIIVVVFSVILTGKVANHSEMSSSHLCLLENDLLVYSFLVPLL